MLCARVIPRLSIQATTLAAGFSSPTGSNTAGAAIYDDADAGAQLAEVTSSLTASTAQVIKATGLSFTLTAGMVYRVCVCGSVSGINYLGIYDTNEAALLRAFTTTQTGTAANNCSSGNPPATTGALTGSTKNPPVVVVTE